MLQFDPAMQRFTAMRVNTYDHFKANARTSLIGFMLVIVPLFGYTYAMKTQRDAKEAELRNGLIAYSQRKFKFV